MKNKNKYQCVSIKAIRSTMKNGIIFFCMRLIALFLARKKQILKKKSMPKCKIKNIKRKEISLVK